MIMTNEESVGTPHVLPEKPKTFAEILAFLDAVDAGLVAATPEQMADMGELLVSKVDHTAETIDELEFQAERLRVASAKLAEGKRQILARTERMREYMAHHMAERQFTQIPGDLYKVRLSVSTSVEPLTKAPPPAVAEKHPDLVRPKFEWNKIALKAALEAGDPVAATFAELVPSKTVQFDVNKGKLLR